MAELETSTLERMGEIDQQRVRIADEQMKTALRKAQGVMQVTTQMLVKALAIVQERAPDRMPEFPAPEEDEIDRAARAYQRRKHINDVSEACIFCGCTKDNACVTGGKSCHWTAENVCSACVDLHKQLLAERDAFVDRARANESRKLRTRTKPRSAKKPARKAAKKASKKRRAK